ncbi:Bifunctional AAC/APH [termite gut metagenome]|uniref:Bifunctional AAC/APH n=1 Tax=termite gut metagenome TaxID=433724 RepID=A0A5J4RR48_9ZZZZ
MILHKGELEINERIVKILINEQFPGFNNLLIKQIPSIGTVNVLFKLGDEYIIRLPRLKEWEESILKERTILSYLAPFLTIRIPEPVASGNPTSLYPAKWAIYRWIEGDIFENSKKVNEYELARDLANFIMELHSIGLLPDAPRAGRKPLKELNDVTYTAINAIKTEINHIKTIEIWKKLLQTPVWDNKPVWIHADLLKANILINSGRLNAIIDFGSAGTGDPAFDIIPAWTILKSGSRELFRELLDVDDNTWRRASGYALHQALLIIPYYQKTNPMFVRQALETINEIINDKTIRN